MWATSKRPPSASAWSRGTSEGDPTLGRGELVVTDPMPSMPLCFWGDPDGTRYQASYFETFPGVWRHGDFIELGHRGILIHGRSDSTLNRNGIRLGSADIYAAVEALPEVAEAMVVGAEMGTDYYMPLFVKLADGVDAADARTAIESAIRANLSARYLPDEIVVMAGIPHTKTGKKLEVPVKRLIQGARLDEVADLGAVDDPALLEDYARFARRGRRPPREPLRTRAWCTFRIASTGPRGRSMAIRSEQSRQAILQSTMKLLDEREPGSMSVQQLSIERIAREAGVSKTTIYRWWPDKAAVIIDTFLENHILLTPMREDLPPIEALREHVVALAAVYAGHEGRLMAQLLAESQYDPATLEEFKAQFWRPRREVVNRMIERAIEAGSIRGDRTADEIAERIYAPIYFKLLFGEGSFDPDTMRAGFDLALEGIAPR